MRRELIDKQEERFGVSILLLGKLFFVGKFEGVRNLLSSHIGVNRIFIARELARCATGEACESCAERTRGLITNSVCHIGERRTFAAQQVLRQCHPPDLIRFRNDFQVNDRVLPASD